MNKDIKEKLNVAFGYLLGTFLVLAVVWLIFNIIVWLICLCFNITFNLLLGTGLWLCHMLLWFTLRSAIN